ncbi:potassium-transporting ATPase subunit KdpA [Mycobacteroides immunogenum]|uniref:Potassium-transporting ATPase potassium-binding subunit n=1 Tax=Mycobacteroides immunogenum TaxID=83262 RepID=A0A7V8LP00_9MYCO|nr:potassium-transporting ATPase subunit KdpA [Mycobacteroides immunogenum]AMT71760.1 potassium-transporting ATPase subunit A [Mycobacteroides immunogenum]ANO04882.1 K+-transporting ATPase subunit A [Mycobacteroides immunogenum]KIU39019.1 potassium-transporting ATPase subunit A [Mycobacteroides immunogenum]KPG04379.1 potassium-transporting ATPase subunit A [Mycobacteroides immunogenum]KPG07229.1 potassium-transporting ATPase subunit A [Mycobacteroides immunogenum]
MNPAVAAGLQIGFVLIVLAIAYVPLGDYMARVFTVIKHSFAERLIYRVGRVSPETEQTWVGYTLSLLGFSFVSVLFLYVLQRAQGVLPLSGDLDGVSPAVAFNTATSFVTNTNWQSYVPESTMSNLTQMVGLAVQNFVSAGVGLAVAIAFIRGIVRVSTSGELGNFWVDLVRGNLRILLPLSFLVALILLSQGVIQSVHTHFDATALDGASQHVALAPVASQEAIKELGTNGGGILGANSAHPFENPTPLSNIVEILAILIIPVSLTRTYSTMVGDQRQGITILSVMVFLWAGLLAFVTWAESSPRGIAAQAAGAMMEGKEVRFGIPATTLFAVSTTGTSTGAVNAAHDSFSAAGGGALILNMLFGEIAPGGVGTGMYGILILAIIAVFVGGLLVGRTPEFLGKKIGRREMTMAALSVLVMPALVLIGSGIAIALSTTPGYQGNSGDPGSPQSIHGFSEVLYAYASAANNNGSAFGGLTVTSHWFQASLGVAMVLGRFLPIIFTLALAGSLAAQKRTPVSAGTLHTHGPMFAGLHAGTVLLVAALTFFPALALGPIAEAVL